MDAAQDWLVLLHSVKVKYFLSGLWHVERLPSQSLRVLAKWFQERSDASPEWIAFSRSSVAASGFGVAGVLDWEISRGTVKYRITRQRKTV